MQYTAAYSNYDLDRATLFGMPRWDLGKFKVQTALCMTYDPYSHINRQRQVEDEL